MYILGVSCFYHDSGAVLIKNGEIIAAAQEERFTRKKNCSEFPRHAINYCLKEADITIKNVSAITFNEKPFLKFQRVILDHINCFPFSFSNFIRTMPHWLDQRLILPVLLKKTIGYEGKVYFVKHHTAHAASSFFASGFSQSSIITADSIGEWETTTLCQGKKNKIRSIKNISHPHSLGLLYSSITSFLGFKANSDEGKIMALADYGKPSFKKEFKEILKTKQDGSFKLNTSLINPNRGNRMYNKKLIKLLGPPRKPKEKIEDRHFDIAATLQKTTEETLIKIANYLYSKQPNSKNLCLAGGVFLNCVANSKILKETPFEDIFIQPAAGDSGGALGAALYIDSLLNKNSRPQKMKHSFLGPSYSQKEIKKTISLSNLRSKNFESEDKLAKTIAQKIYENKIIGVFKGRMEWGPRALGARSILANPINPKMKDTLNEKVKHREWFRPFGIMILEEDCKDYFEHKKSPFMLLADYVKQNKQKLIPSGLHVNNTSRIQTLNQKENPFSYKVVSEFKKLTGVPVIINTSFNDKGEPIVCSPQDAINCFKNTEIDCLVLESSLIKKHN